MSDEVKIKVGFGDDFRELTVTLPEGDVAPYSPDDRLSVVGSAANRVDGPAKVTGAAKYTYDQNPTGLLHGKILRCPHPNANIKNVDVTPALAMPGVKAALSFPEVFRRRTVRFAWDGVAAVAAETEEQALAALEKIVVEYEVLPFSVTIEDSIADNAPQVGRRDQENVMRTSPRIPFRRDGSFNEEREKQNVEEMAEREKTLDEILAGSPNVISARFETEVQTHACLETHGIVCRWEEEKLICHCSTQATFGVLREMTMRQGPVRAREAQVLCEYIGGGFGSKFFSGREGVAGALLAREAGRPVKLMLDRREEHTGVGNRPGSRQELTLATDIDGTIQGLRVRSWGSPGASPQGGGAVNDAIYKLGAVDKVEYGVRTNTGGARPQRAPGWPQGIFALESAIDAAAAQAKIDPIEMRRKNDDHPIRKTQYTIAAERAGWKRRPQLDEQNKDRIVKRGIGCASATWYQAGGGGARVLVRLHKDGRVEVRNGAQDIGTGTRTVMGMVVAEELGLQLDDVTTFIGDTTDPRGPGSGGSTTAPTILPAARLAAVRAAEDLIDLVAAEYDWDPADLTLRRGEVARVDGGELPRRVTFRQACALIPDDSIEVLERRPIIHRRKPNYEGYSDSNAGVQIAEVEVDTETGEVRVLRVTAVQDAGKLINPKTAESQVRGGIIQGVSYALFERRIMDRQEGRMLNADLEGYKIVGSLDCPDLDVVMQDVYMGRNNVHVMGLGEPPVISTAAAVANAVSHAIGVRITKLPITPKSVLEALERRNG